MNIDQSQVGKLLAETLLARMGDEVDLIFHYGSFVKGNTHRYSDFDISFVPVHESTGYSITVAVNDILCDLYPIHWSGLENMATFRNPSYTVLHHSRITYQRTQEAGERFAALCENQRKFLLPTGRSKMLKLALDIYQKVGYDYYQLHRQSSTRHLPSCRLHAQRLLATIFHCLAVCNQRSIDTRKLPEVFALPRLPEGFTITVERIGISHDPVGLLAACQELLDSTQSFLLAEQRTVHRHQVTFAAAFGVLYPELKNMLQKIIIACEADDTYDVNARVIGFYEELFRPLALATSGVNYSGFNALADFEQDLSYLGFPALLPLAEAHQFEALRRECVAFDEQLQQFLCANGVPLYSFASIGELRQHLSDLAQKQA